MPPAAAAARDACVRFDAALPARLNDLQGRRTSPASDLTAAWGEPPVVLRCGLGLPEGFRTGASITEIDGVAWFQQVAGSRVTWTTVDRLTQVQLIVPTSYQEQGAFLVDLATAIKTALPQQAQQPLPTPSAKAGATP